MSDERFIIDVNTRAITVPPTFTNAGVISDHNALKVNFEIGRTYDGEDLSTHNIVIQYINAKGEKDVHSVTDKDLTTPDKIIFSWELSNHVTKYAGTVSFNVRFYSTVDNVYTYTYGTQSASFTILDGITVSLGDITTKLDILNLIPTKITDLTDNGNFVHKDREETINGAKTFTDNVLAPNLIGGDTAYGGSIVTNLDTIIKNGFYTCYGTATGAPNSSSSWFVIHQNSNAGTISATQRGIAYGDNSIVLERKKIDGVWKDWVLHVSRSEFDTAMSDINSQLEQAANKTDGGLDRLKITGGFVTNSNSWIALLNTVYDGDNGTRLYIIPKNIVSTGTGSALKLFADPYHEDDVNYRDMGIFFAADLLGDTGQDGIGAYYINGKTNGSYNGKYTDIIFSYQDGSLKAGRYCVIKKDGSSDEAILVLGSAAPRISNLVTNVCAEIQKNVVINNDTSLMWSNAARTAIAGSMRVNNSNDTIMSLLQSLKVYINATEKLSINSNETKLTNDIEIYGAVKTTKTWNQTTNSTLINVSSFARVKFVQLSNNTITSLGGVNGQKLTILFTNANTTIQHNATIKLSNGDDFVGSADSILVLENFDGIWYEASRSINHA